ncbi:MAG: GNAT family N-acetyltransferase [Cyanobacteria bacterium J069]|nr:MAG: GNAT family N-acetyltransferase [Cyanobacteria bacterium J069]
MPQIAIATSDQDLLQCFPVLLELRSHLLESEFVTQVRRQAQQGYQVAYLSDNHAVQSVAGFRLMESLSAGKFVYVDDLITTHTARSQGYGEALFSWLVDYARDHGCQSVALDSGVQRFEAHRFYLRQRMAIVAHHFSLPLS